MATDWDLFIDEVKDGGHLRGLGALVLNAGVVEGLHFQLLRPIAKHQGAGTRVGEIHWNDLKPIEAKIAKEWLTHFLSGPLMFFVLLRARPQESKMRACRRLVEHLEGDKRVPGDLDRRSSTLHLDLDDSDPRSILRELRRTFGVLRAFKWDSKGSLLLQLSDLLLGIAIADRDGSLDSLGSGASTAQLRKRDVLEHARLVARRKAARNKINAVVQLDKQNHIQDCLLGT